MKNEECRMKNLFYSTHIMSNFHSSFLIFNFYFLIINRLHHEKNH